MIDKEVADEELGDVGDAFSLADCSAAPALFYASKGDAVRRRATKT